LVLGKGLEGIEVKSCGLRVRKELGEDRKVEGQSFSRGRGRGDENVLPGEDEVHRFCLVAVEPDPPGLKVTQGMRVKGTSGLGVSRGLLRQGEGGHDLAVIPALAFQLQKELIKGHGSPAPPKVF